MKLSTLTRLARASRLSRYFMILFRRGDVMRHAGNLMNLMGHAGKLMHMRGCHAHMFSGVRLIGMLRRINVLVMVGRERVNHFICRFRLVEICLVEVLVEGG